MSSRRASRRPPSPWLALLLLAVVLVPTTLAASQHHETRSKRTQITFKDRRAPRPVRNLEVTAADAGNITVDWSRSYDNVGVEGYGVYLDGSQITTTANTGYTLRQLACGKGYTVGVDAFDDAGNRSRPTSTFVSTAACPDVTPPTPPVDVKTVAATQTAVVLSWAPSSDDIGVVAYELYVGGFWVGAWSEPSATIANLSCGQTYSVDIDAIDAAGNRSARTETFFSTAACADHTPPSPPEDVVVTDATQDSVALSWTAAKDDAGVSGYGVYLDGKQVDTTSTTNGEVGGLTCGTTHTFGVDAADAAQNRSSIVTVSAATAPCASSEPPPPPTDPTPPPPSGTDTTPPSAPPNLHTSSVSQTVVVLQWDSSTDAGGMAGYQIFRDGTKIGEGPGVHGGLTNQWTDSNRTCGTLYHYAVAGVDSAGNVGPKSTLDVTTTACDPTSEPPPPPTDPTPPADTSAPTTPTGVTASTRTETSIALGWKASTDNVGVVGYGLYRNGSRIATVTGTTGIFSGLTCGTNYTLSVDAVDAAGNRSQQAVTMVSTTACGDTQAPSTPTNLAASNVGQTGLTLTWSAAKDNVGVTGYSVLRNGTVVTTTTATQFSDSGRSCGTSYTYGVQARDAAGNASPAATLTVSTLQCAPTTTSLTLTPSEFSAHATSGATIQNVTVTGSASISAPNVTVKNATIQGDVQFNSGSSGSSISNSSAHALYIWGADNITVDGNVFDGQNQTLGGKMWDEPAGNPPQHISITNNVFKNQNTGNVDDHTQALYVGYATDVLIQGNDFENNGSTSHIFFTWFGELADPSVSYPRNVCVKGNTFGPTAGAYFDVNFRAEIPVSANIVIQRDASNTDPEFYGSC